MKSAQPGVRVASLAAGTWQKVSVPLCFARCRRSQRREWLLDPGRAGRRSPHLLYRQHRAGVRRSADAAAAGQRHEHLRRRAGQRLAELELGHASTLRSTTTVHTGSSAIAVTADAFEALYLQHDAMPTDAYETLKFWINGGATGGQTLNVVALRSDVAQPAVQIGPLAANTWQEVRIPLAQLGIANAADLIGPVAAGQCRRHSARRSTWTTSAWNSRRRPASSTSPSNPKQRIRKVDPRMFGIERGGLGWRVRLTEHAGAAHRTRQPGAALPRRFAVGRVSLGDQHERRSDLRMGHELR